MSHWGITTIEFRELFENDNSFEKDNLKSKRFRKITRTAVRSPRTCGPGIIIFNETKTAKLKDTIKKRNKFEISFGDEDDNNDE